MAVNYRDILTLEKVGFFKFFFFPELMSFGKTALHIFVYLVLVRNSKQCLAPFYLCVKI
jgi:hypothetical protein